MARDLVTGGAGFVGSHLVEALLGAGRSVRVLDDLSSGKVANLEPFLGDIDLVRADIRDADAVHRAMDGVEVCYHQAAMASVPRSVAHPVLTADVNIGGSLRVLDAARAAGVRRVVLASSSSVYGDQARLPLDEAMVPAPRSPYALQKLTVERFARLFHEIYGLETVALRYFNVYGPRQDEASPYAAVVPLFLAAARRGEAAVIYGDSEGSRDFTFVEDVVRANVLAAQAPRAAGRVMNVAGGGRTTIRALWTLISRLFGGEIPPRHEPARPGDIRHSQASAALARDLLGWTAEVPIEEGLTRTKAWYDRRAP